MNETINTSPQNKKIELKDIIHYFRKVWQQLLSKWLIVLIFGFSGALIGISLSFIIKPKYKASLSFALVDKSSYSSGLANLASSLGLSSMLGGSSDTFSGDNLIEIIKSKHVIEKTLLSAVNFEGEDKTLADLYIQLKKIDKKWHKSDNPELRNLNFPIDQERESFSRTQDSVLASISQSFIKRDELQIERKDKKTDIVNVDFISINEKFSKLFVEHLIAQTYDFYKNTKIAQSKGNINLIQHAADSIKELYESALYASASVAQTNINRASQLALVPRLKEEYNVQLYGSVYSEVLKNLETAKLEMARETPIFQIIDKPIYPLKKIRIGKLKGLVFGGFAGGILIVFFFMGRVFWDDFLV